MNAAFIFFSTFAAKNKTIKIVKKLVRVIGLGLSLVFSVLSIGCQGSQKGGSEGNKIMLKDSVLSDSLKSEMALALEREVVLDRVKCIYTLIQHENTYMGGSVDSDMLDKTFCTKRWNQLLMAVRAKEHQTNTLFFEVNRWTMAYNSELIDFDEFEVADLIIGPNNHKTAVVNFTVYDPDSYTPARIELVYEDGQWKIDNFYHLKYMLNLRQCMYRYLDNDMLYLI